MAPVVTGCAVYVLCPLSLPCTGLSVFLLLERIMLSAGKLQELSVGKGFMQNLGV